MNFVFNPEEWFTPNTYDINFKDPPNKSGIYLIVHPDMSDSEIDYKILYVGSSKDLFIRYKGHTTLRLLNEVYGYVQFYFKEVEDNWIGVEKSLIKQIQPKFNTQWR